jgi:hypothetical protein
MSIHDKDSKKLSRQNCSLAKRLWLSNVNEDRLNSLRHLTDQYRFSISAGHLLLLDGRWYITHVGLVDYAKRHHCLGIHIEAVPEFCDPISHRWAFKATAFVSRTCKGFVGYGDADPSNVSPLVRGAEMRVAETRAVNRALRKAYGIGLCSVEEIGSPPGASEGSQAAAKIPPHAASGNGTGNGNGGPRVRDRLCQLIRQHQLDPDLVKAYAVDFCGAKTLKEATRAQVESFVDHLADCAAKDRDALLCQLNSYPRTDTKSESKAGAA